AAPATTPTSANHTRSRAPALEPLSRTWAFLHGRRPRVKAPACARARATAADGRGSAHGADEGGGVGVELVELEAAGVVVRAVALEDPVGLPVVEHRAVLDARRGPDRAAGEVAQFDDRAESLGDGAAL